MKTLAQAHDELVIAITILEEKKTVAVNARNKTDERMLDIHEAKVYQAEKIVVDTAKDFIYYLSEAAIKF